MLSPPPPPPPPDFQSIVFNLKPDFIPKNTTRLWCVRKGLMTRFPLPRAMDAAALTVSSFPQVAPIKIYPFRREVAKINEEALVDLPGEMVSFRCADDFWWK